ncbi:MAG: sialate O-acetylesterase [Candidatus Latescibacterota bacterium]
MKTKRTILFLLLCALSAFCSAAFAEVLLPAVFSENMVLQRDMKIPVWGTATPGESITVSFAGKEVKTSADKNSRWEVKLEKYPAGGPYEMTVSGTNTIKFRNVMVGEVWVCSGQSNMWWPIEREKGIEPDIAGADFPDIRLFTVWTPEHDAYGQKSEWVPCNPKTVLPFSAVGFFFGRKLSSELHVPIGLIHTSMGGSVPEAWMTKKTLAKDPEFRPILAYWDSINMAFPAKKALYDKNPATQGKQNAWGTIAPGTPEPPLGPGHRRYYMHYPENLWHSQLASLIPYGIRGVVWYQGESSAPRACQYRRLFPAMIREWRQAWKQGDFPFIYAQLAKYKTGSAASPVPELREAQLKALSAPATGMAVIIDLGDSTSVHANNKWDVGNRLAFSALHVAYGKDIPWSGPLYKSMKKAGNKIRISFRYADDGFLSPGGEKLSGFTIAGKDSIFHPAEAAIVGSEVEVSSALVPDPVSVRYAWESFPFCNLYSKAGLAASPFRTDSWPEITKGRVIPFAWE